MAYQYWTTEKYNTATAAWDTEDKLPAGTLQFTEPVRSTMQELFLHDGSRALMTPSTKFIRENIMITWHQKVAAAVSRMVAQLVGYVENHNGIRITLGTGDKIAGYVIRFEKQWIPGKSTQRFLLIAEILRFNIDSTGTF